MKSVSIRRVLIAAGIYLALLPGSVLAVAYVLYDHTFGDWTVVCWRGMVEGEKSCYIDAPPVDYNVDPHTIAVRIEPIGKAVHVVVSARSGTAHGVTVRLNVDGKNVQEGQPDRLDHVTFEGDAAAALIDQFRSGHALTIELPDVERTARISLAGFKDAYAAFEDNLSRFGAPVSAPASGSSAGESPGPGLPAGPSQPGAQPMNGTPAPQAPASDPAAVNPAAPSPRE
jgi:invasion protein IalB